MNLTVCICTYDRPRYVEGCLTGLAGQTADRSRFEIVVVDSGSTDDAAADLRRLAKVAGARLVRVGQPGISAARNAGAHAAQSPYIAYIDDDAIPAADWVETILAAIAEPRPPPAIIGGRILPQWESPLPAWWPASLRGVLSIIEHDGCGEYRTPALPRGLEPYGANIVVHVPALLAAGGFGTGAGRYGRTLLSDEEVQLAWRLQEAGHSVRYDSRIVVHHQIQTQRLNPSWLLSRLYWQGVSTVLTRRLLKRPDLVWRELPRRLALALVCAPVALVPPWTPWLIALRWRQAYATGFSRAALGWRPGRANGRPAA